MSGAKFRLILAAICFCGWLGWLAYLSLNYSRTIIVSRSQMMFATQAARAKITVENGIPNRIELLDLLGKNPSADTQPIAEKIDPADLKLVLLPFQKPLTESGVYLVPVRRTAGRLVMVAPPSSLERDGETGRFLIYPDTPSVEEQIRNLLPEGK